MQQVDYQGYITSPSREPKTHVAKQKYSILIDESTDIATDKHLCVLIRYYSESKAITTTEYVGLLPVVGAKGSELFASSKAKLLEMGLQMRWSISNDWSA